MIMKYTKTNVKNMQTSRFPYNAYFDLEGCHFLEKKYVSFDEIFINMENNICRDGYSHTKNIHDMIESFSDQIVTAAPLPVIELLSAPIRHSHNGVEDTYNYKLIDGYTRIEALKNLGYTGYWFDIGKFDNELASITFAISNNKQLPKAPSNRRDLFSLTSNLVSKGLIGKEVKDVSEYIVANKLAKKSLATEIAQEVAIAHGSNIPITLYTQQMIKDDADFFGIEREGSEDCNRNELGWIFKNRYEREFLLNAILSWYKTGKTSYFTLYTDMPSKGVTVYDMNEKLVDNLLEIENALFSYIEWQKQSERYCWRIHGALPQSQKDRCPQKKIVKLKKRIDPKLISDD